MLFANKTFAQQFMFVDEAHKQQLGYIAANANEEYIVINARANYWLISRVQGKVLLLFCKG